MRGLTSLLVLASVLSAGCATGYQARSLTGGYRDIKLSEDTYMVSFLANAYTSPENVQIYLLYRCAELTIQKGFDYFIPVESVSQAITGADPLVGGATMSKPGHATTIQMFKGQKPADNPRAMDARELMANLRPHVK